ncbi:MAG: hypothetical protein P1T08_18725 [Acidimicrobiia bacterium]|nr:hypothetical protein [Acidimicrobiia bacterium]
MTNRELWFRIVVRAFPQEYRVEHENEIVEAVLTTSPDGFWSGVRESVALVRAGVGMTARHSGTKMPLLAVTAWGAAIWLGGLLGAGAFVRPLVGASESSSVAEFATGYWAALLGAVLLLIAVVLARRSIWMAAVAGAAGVALTALWNSDPYWGFPSSLWYEFRWLGLALIGYALVARHSAAPVWAFALASAMATIAFSLLAGVVRLGESYSTLWWNETVRASTVILVIVAVVLVWFVRGLGAVAIVPIAHLTMALALRLTGEALIGGAALIYFATAAYLSLKRRPQVANLQPSYPAKG